MNPSSHLPLRTADRHGVHCLYGRGLLDQAQDRTLAVVLYNTQL